MCSDINVLNVTIYGAEYPVRGARNKQNIQKVAEYLDNKMREVNKKMRVDSSLKVAILAALNITDELFQEREANEALKTQLEDRIKQINTLIDHKLTEKK